MDYIYVCNLVNLNDLNLRDDLIYRALKFKASNE